MFKPELKIMTQNTSIKVILYTSKTLKNGEHPIMLRVIKNRKSKYISVGHSCDLRLWDMKNERPKKSHPNKRLLDILIETKIQEAHKNLLSLEINQGHFSVESITKKIRNDIPNKNVYEFIDSIVEQKRLESKLGTSGVYKQTKAMLIAFTKNNSLLFSDITPSFLHKYESFFRMKGTKEISISYYMRTLRAVYNKAITEGFGAKDLYPFNEYTIGKLNTRTVKRAITKEDIKKIIATDINEDSRLFHSKNYFLFSYYTMGTNYNDICTLKWENIKQNRLKYIRAKTNKPYDVGLLEPAIEILNF
ncbi:MAG: hypothetical protein BWY22_00847 [Bacteroidetes bacterium ADurb.Bin217]|nr:MAG: hypothetical protein BWY22_00847 [Bacteroidetes bacterium ADurb.Bin217]